MSHLLLPVFPLPNFVLFPGVVVPLHIFEPRYRALVTDALAGDCRFGIVLLRSGWEAEYEGRPPVHAIGCVAGIVAANPLEDGRFDLVIRGVERFRIVSEDHERVYRRAVVEVETEAPIDAAGRQAVEDLRKALLERLGPWLRSVGEDEATASRRLADMPDEEFVHTVAQYLELEPIERQAVLECDGVASRAALIRGLIEMKRLATPQGPAGLTH